jgi:hypothetical protein
MNDLEASYSPMGRSRPRTTRKTKTANLVKKTSSKSNRRNLNTISDDLRCKLVKQCNLINHSYKNGLNKSNIKMMGSNPNAYFETSNGKPSNKIIKSSYTTKEGQKLRSRYNQKHPKQPKYKSHKKASNMTYNDIYEHDFEGKISTQI